MDVGHFVVESAAFTRAALGRRHSRWLALILLGLPWMVLSSRAGSWNFIEGTRIHWDLIPWREAGVLILAGTVCNFLISGYIVRLLRDDPAPPDFAGPLLLCLDGIKVHVIPLVWMLAPSVLAFVQYSIADSGMVSGSPWESNLSTILILVLLAIQIVILFIAVQYAMIGAIRFARTGSVREGFALLEIKKVLDRIGIVNYFLGLAVVTILWMVVSLCLSWIALVPFAGPVLALCLWPVLTVFCFRFIAHFCDEEHASVADGREKERGVPTPGPVPARVILPEILIWLVCLVVLVVLCFTPLVLIFGSLGRLFPW
jgi:hypothetical protein